jgi:DNA anti-recombination protein RmuC
MGDPTMTLGAEDVRRIADYVKPWLRDTILEMVPRRPSEIDTQLLERMVRVEEELKAQRELMAERFDAVDKRFAASDKRFEDLQRSLDKRFEDVQAASEKRFEDLHRSLDKRFDASDRRFEDLHRSLDKRFDASDRRADDARAASDRRFASLQWTILVGLAVVTAAVTVFGLFA